MSESQPVQRWETSYVDPVIPSPDGRFVAYVDHVAALAERDRLHAEALLGAFDEGCRATERNYVKGFADALDKAWETVAALDVARDAVAALLAEFPNPEYQIANAAVHTALAAIDALRGGSGG